MKNKLKEMKGITLIALVITIIVLLILAGVSIATLTGENGILTQANTASKKTAEAEAEEMFKLIANEWSIEKRKTGAQPLADFLNAKKEAGELDKVTDNGDGTYTIEYKGYQTIINSEGKLVGDISKVEQTPTVTYNPETLEIGDAINSENYGKKVTNYNVKTEETGGWRLFYQDNSYTYLISDNCIGSYEPRSYYSSYTNGSYVSTVGQRLNKKLLDNGTFFIANNASPNIRAVAWLTDTEADIWKQYKNNDAVFAIGSPTAELYKASFDATSSANGATTFTLEIGTNGYNEGTTSGQLKTSYNDEIYNNSTSWWLASPSDASQSNGLYVQGGSSKINYYYVNDDTGYGVRPIVCILTSVFNSNYASTLVSE